ncbi:hypothetical protein DL765_002842 [Monosporascus sp. GIB2]|nr:hypothetical protein DL765_002842 [Monosporascus sp. GIB2]
MRRPRTSTALHEHDACGKAAAKANQACHSCKRQKRKCDKAMPSCGLCSRMSRTCDYSDIPPAPTAEDIMGLQLKLLELESRLKNTGTASLMYLQALILVALYEYGQGIYPATWMTGTWMEVEERRRTWWGVYILDKLVAIGSRKRTFSTEPSPNEMLPVADSAFEAGDIGAAVQGTVFAPFTEPQSPFSRVCQGAMLISRALDHARRAELRKLNGEPGDAVEVGNLTDSASRLFVSIQRELVAQPAAYFSLVPALCMALSAATTTLATYTAGDAQVGGFATAGIPGLEGCGDGLSLRVTALEALRKTAARARDLARDLSAMTASDEEAVKASPFVLGAVYSAAAETFFLAAPAPAPSWKGDSNCGDDLLATTTVEAARKCLARLSPRWRLAGEYLRALDPLEMNVVIARSF